MVNSLASPVGRVGLHRPKLVKFPLECRMGNADEAIPRDTIYTHAKCKAAHTQPHDQNTQTLCFLLALNDPMTGKDTLPEWSKGVDSSSTSATCVGSNPTDVIFVVSWRPGFAKSPHNNSRGATLLAHLYARMHLELWVGSDALGHGPMQFPLAWVTSFRIFEMFRAST